MRRIRACNCWGIGGRPGRDLSRQNNLHPARCQRIIVSGRTATSKSRQSQNFESIDSTIRVAGYSSPLRAAFNVEGELSTQKEVLGLKGPR